MYAGIGEATIPTFKLADQDLPAPTAAQIVRDELMLDGNARLNLATFVTTWMEPEACDLMACSFDKNIVDRDEYPQSAEIERRCVNILAHLWNSPDDEQAVGCSTTGSSEAAMLGGLALKRRWQANRRAAGLDDTKPNIVMGINVQVCWEKFCRYFDVEARLVPLEAGRRHLTAASAIPHCDDHTIGVVGILGSTFDGSYEPIADIAAALDRLHADGGPDIPMHVDAASGGFVAPFLDPDLSWDFRLRRVASINTSGHKYGLVYPNVGWVVWRDDDALPDELVFSVNYLGGNESTFSLNFSRSGAPVIAQYYNFLRLGEHGYRRVQTVTRDVARHLVAGIDALEPFELLTRAVHLPVFAFTVREDEKRFTVYDVSRALRERGWLVPAYALPEHLEQQSVLRIVVRNGFSRDLGDGLLADLKDALTEVQSQPGPLSNPVPAFHH
ncbi:MAG TPA: glutamate decarboxylase [Acidimicrobiia bacterium]|nr:glutamate decarboxylase [Acidimicrobiia bacterium]